MMSLRGDLGEVRHAQHLTALAEGTQLAPDALWRDAVIPVESNGAAWATDLLQGPLSADSLDRHRTMLRPEEAAIIEAETGDLYRRLCTVAKG